MSKTESAMMALARHSAGYRERYAMEHGQRVVFFQNGKEFWKFSYSPDAEFQDANGATFCVANGKWVN